MLPAHGIRHNRIVAVDQHTLDFAVSQFAELGHITVKKMFGGAGLYADGMIFALLDDGEIYIKVDAVNQPEFEAIGSQIFTYAVDETGPKTLNYWLLDSDRLAEKAECLKYGQLGIEASLRAAEKKRPKKPKL